MIYILKYYDDEVGTFETSNPWRFEYFSTLEYAQERMNYLKAHNKELFNFNITTGKIDEFI